MFKAILLPSANAKANYTDLDLSQLTKRDVLIKVNYSSLNYKDGLAITGSAPVVRNYPMVAGIDVVGIIWQTDVPNWPIGTEVIINGHGLGELYWGGMASYITAQADWLINLPSSLNAQQAMAIGTAGYTAMLCVLAIEKHGITPDSGAILVTGASGGVGSIAVAILANLGYEVIASTGRDSEYLSFLGANQVINRSELQNPANALAKPRWIAVVDSVGSHTLARACAHTAYGGIVTACGLAGGMDFPATVAPFILRAVSLVGIDSVYAPIALRQQAWQRLATDLPLDKLATLSQVIPLEQVIEYADKIMQGQIRGRTVVAVND